MKISKREIVLIIVMVILALGPIYYIDQVETESLQDNNLALDQILGDDLKEDDFNGPEVGKIKNDSKPVTNYSFSVVRNGSKFELFQSKNNSTAVKVGEVVKDCCGGSLDPEFKKVKGVDYITSASGDAGFGIRNYFFYNSSLDKMITLDNLLDESGESYIIKDANKVSNSISLDAERFCDSSGGVFNIKSILLDERPVASIDNMITDTSDCVGDINGNWQPSIGGGLIPLAFDVDLNNFIFKINVKSYDLNGATYFDELYVYNLDQKTIKPISNYDANNYIDLASLEY
jgi:hypothetical protein